MSIVCIIPARGGSKRMPRKNLLPVGGAPLIAHSIRHARAAPAITEIYVSTDSEEIAGVVRQEGGEVVVRPVEIAGDSASSESALLHVLDVRHERGLAEPDLVVFLQPTSPVRRAGDIGAAIETLRRTGADSVFSATPNKALIWGKGRTGLSSLNYDFHRRRREQEMEVQFRENGSIYVFKPRILREHGNRLGGKIEVHEMDVWTSFQIDEPADLELCAWIMDRPEFTTSASPALRSTFAD